MDLARKAEAKYAKGGPTRALEGSPVGIKDESEIKGKPTSSGSLIMKDYVGETTSTMNERILRAGASSMPAPPRPSFPARASAGRGCGGDAQPVEP